MIKIEYKTATPHYDEYLDKFQDWLKRNLEGSPSCIKHNGRICEKTGEFLTWLLEGGKLKELCKAKADDLIEKINEIKEREHDNHDLEDKDSVLYKDLYKLFVKHGYTSGFTIDKKEYKLDKDELYEATGVEVCPYCNRIYIRKHTVKNGNKTVKGELDHFYSKELFPYLAIAKYNLVPSCSFCNGRGGKFTENAYEKNMKNPFAIKDNNADMTFKLNITSQVTNMETASNGLNINIDIKAKNEMINNVDVFNLRELYSHHIDHAAELYLKSIMYGTNPYREFVQNQLKKANITLTDDEIERVIWGNYSLPEDFGKRPLAKLYHDIGLELKLSSKKGKEENAI